jgi:hypothetical protein
MNFRTSEGKAMNHFSIDMLEADEYVESPTKPEMFREKRKWERRSPQSSRSQRAVAEPIGTLAVRPSPVIGLVNRILSLALEEGPQLLYTQPDGAVHAVPATHRLAAAMWSSPHERILGVYDQEAKFAHIYTDLNDVRESMRRAL